MVFSKVRLFFVCFLTFIVIAAPFSNSVQAEEPVQLDYVALGDSLAVGVTPTRSVGSSYSDFLAKQLLQINHLGTYTKQYAAPGYTSTQVLEDIQNDVRKKNMDGSEDTEGIQKHISEAEMITLNIGANDMLAVIDIDPHTGTISYDEEVFAQVLSDVGKNIVQIISLIKTLNPSADIYVMGYYNPFPYLPDSEQPKVLIALEQLNNVINTAASSTGATYVPTAEAFNPNGKEYLSNPQDIHPNETGYLVLANSFWKLIEVKDAEVFTDVDLEKWSHDSIQYLVKKGIIKGYGDGTFGPDDFFRRDHASQMLTRSIVYNPEVPPAAYTDLALENPAFPMISILSHNGILQGYKDGTFKPENSLTRAEMAIILVKAHGLEGSGEGTFTDVPNTHWAYDAINTLAEHGITIGVGNNKYAPNRPVEREEFATFLERALHQ
ncbi:S-layer homology domain-containing protein [Alkalihalobacillus sp. TS-13]|uniref:S-layer homology domain-containing protein n=1 Tax=Alkalihalobacillus sp. TS-13 TaxID=2842455 RepID=UPI001C883207|nr:S-layer homology domain-containing protein [Alkalihalobacillus sp. TS-13]